jgi:hypothetical protein
MKPPEWQNNVYVCQIVDRYCYRMTNVEGALDILQSASGEVLDI